MDPPCFTRTQCQKILEIESGLEDIHKMIEEKASRIEERLGKIESNHNGHDGSLEEEKELRIDN